MTFAIDLTQHRALLASGSADSGVQPEVLCGQQIPAILLPYFEDETPMAGADAENHRRGTGLKWPPEAQACYHGNPADGCGRLPLPLVWGRLLCPLREDVENKTPEELSRYRKEPFTWHVQHQINNKPKSFNSSISPAEAVIQAAEGWARGHDSNNIALIVPDSLGESAQDDLLRVGGRSRYTLIPRGMAVAADWCRRFEPDYQSLELAADENKSLGYIWVASLGLDAWELDRVEIKACRKKGLQHTFLVPVRHRQRSSRMDICGLEVLASLMELPENEPETCWKRLFASQEPIVLLEKKVSEFSNPAELYKNFGEHAFISEGIFSDDKARRALEDAVDEQVEGIFALPVEGECLGAVCGGACSGLVNWESTLWCAFDSDFKNCSERLVNAPDGSCAGGWRLADAMAKGFPSYLDTLLPIEILVKRNNKGYWNEVIPAMQIPAGDKFKTVEKISGLQFEAGLRKYAFKVRRSLHGKESWWGLDTNELDEPTETEEKVELSASAKPGQGFAEIRVDFENPEISSVLLNWSTLNKIENPIVMLQYIPHVSKVEASEHIWGIETDFLQHEIEHPWKNFDHAGADWPKCTTIVKSFIGNDHPGAAVYKALWGKNARNFNVWPLAHLEAMDRGEEITADYFKHVSVFGSHQKIHNVYPLAGQFRESLAKKFRENKKNGFLVRTGGWMYSSVPDNIRTASVKALDEFSSNCNPINLREFLHVAGLCWDKNTEFKVFITAFSTAITNNRFIDPHVTFVPMQDLTTEWLRSLRNIVRFREDAFLLSDDFSRHIEIITRFVVEVFVINITERVVHNKRSGEITKLYGETLRALPFMLRRRISDPSYLSIKYGGLLNDRTLYENLEESLDLAANALPSVLFPSNPEACWHKVFAQKTLKFLQGEATETDLEGIMTA